MEKLYGILERCCPTVDFRKETALVSEKLIDSIDLVSIVSDLEDEFGIDINMAEIDPANFDSADKMWALIQNLQRK